MGLTMAQNNAASLVGLIFFLVVYLAIIVLVIAGYWKMFAKAGQPGWGAIVPIYNSYLICKIAGRPGWWVILLLIPYLNFIFWIILMLDLAKSFARGVGFAVGMILLPMIFVPIIGFGSSEYHGPSAG